MKDLSIQEKKQIKTLVEVIDNDLFTSTKKLSDLFGLKHESLKYLVKKYRNEFENVGECEVKERLVSMISNHRKSTKKMGRPEVEYMLNEPQAMFLILLSKNKEIVLKFKSYITKEFFRQKKLIIKLISQKQNAEWLEKRASGKIERRLETDVIKEFIEYAFLQGSKNAKKYYMAISKMENQTLFNLDLLEMKYDNLRDLLEGHQLSTLQNADKIVGRALKEGMKKSLPYKYIYKLAKNRVETFVDLIGKTPVGNMIDYKNDAIKQII